MLGEVVAEQKEEQRIRNRKEVELIAGQDFLDRIPGRD